MATRMGGTGNGGSRNFQPRFPPVTDKNLADLLNRTVPKKKKSGVGRLFAIIATILLGGGATLFVAATSIAFVPWLLMLSLGAFGFAQFGFWACVPAGILLSVLFRGGSTKKGS